MIKAKVIEEFTLNDFDKLKNIERKGPSVKGRLFVGDIVECDKLMAKYLTGDNKIGKTVVEIIEIEPTKTGKKKKK